MKFEDDVNNYLIGNKFSNGLVVNLLPKKEKNIPRLDFIQEIVKNKTVLHIGCADHLPLIEEKIKNNIWLHALLLDKAKFCVGIDNNKSAVDFINNKLKINNVFLLDVIKDELPKVITENYWNYIVLGEILEHIDNPVQFLSNLRSKFRDNAEFLIITVPNAFELTNFLFAFKNIEFINTDHRYWFTPFTISKIATISGFNVDNFFFSQTYPHNKFWKRYLTDNYPFLRETLIVSLKFN